MIDIVNNKINSKPNKIKINYKNLINDLDELIKLQAEPLEFKHLCAIFSI